MSARDKFHNAVKQGLEKEGRVITHEPFPLMIEHGEEDKISIDLGAINALTEKSKVREFLTFDLILPLHFSLKP
ncbi:XisH protein [Nostoc sp. PCC 7107]|uniref:XisH protein n=1 Tax=Nostoc sp. PCC 7107 TaxID=317936 RepID=UPI00029F08E5|nr:XisH protein [Nostoc sp. PCC 7107]AFY45018.1 XisH protein [Nostoc sp. PCC 7107]